MTTHSRTPGATRARSRARVLLALLFAALALFAVLFAASVLAHGQVARASELAAPGAAPQLRLATDPLAGRFGSTREDFEAVYGEPLDGEPQPYPLGVPYALEGLGGTAYAFFENNRLISLTLLPEDDGFSVLVLPQVIDTFLPQDFADGWLGEDTDELWVMNLSSPDLAAVVESDVYEQYDAAPSTSEGELYVAVYVTPDGNSMFEIQFRLGWRSQELNDLVDWVNGDGDGEDDQGDDNSDVANDEQDDGSADTSDAEAEYIATITSEFGTLNDSIERFNDLLNDPRFGDQTSIDQLVNIVATWMTAYDTALSLTPPPGYEEIHDAYVGFTESLAFAGLYLSEGDVTSAGALLTQAQEQVTVLLDLLQDATEPALMDIKSGSVQR